MATPLEISQIPVTFKTLGGGLNDTSGPLAVSDNEATSLANIDLDVFGSILERNGYTALNTTAAAASGTAQGLYWYQSLTDKYAIMVNNGKIYKMDSLDGNWDDITGVVSVGTGGIDNYTKLLLHCDGADGSTTFTDNGGGHSFTASGNAQVDTAQQKFGTGSCLLDGTGDYLSTPYHDNFSIGESNFTIDLQARWADLTGQQMFICNGGIGGALDRKGWHFRFNALGNKEINFNGLSANDTTVVSVTSGNDAITTTNTWYHIAIVKNGTNFTIYVNGTANGTSTDSDTFTGGETSDLVIGSNWEKTSRFFNGWLDEIRLSKGAARWTANFTPPTAAYGEYLKQDFDTFLGDVLATDGDNAPWHWTAGNTTASAMTVVSGLTGAKFVKKFQNYCLLANVKVSGVRYPSRFYWSNIKTITTWSSLAFIDVSKDDGDEINGFRQLGDRMIAYKDNSIHSIIFTGDPDVPFISQKTNSSVGCSAPFSIQDANNGHVFASYDGFYFFDGNNSYKLTDRIHKSFNDLNGTKLKNIASLFYRKKNLYMASVADSPSNLNMKILVWNLLLNAWSIYTGMSASAMATFLIEGTEERPYFADYAGYAYRMDNGVDDYPTNTQTAVSANYYTNWKYYEDICDKKGVPHVYLTHRVESSTSLTFGYSYDFFNGNQYTQTFSLTGLAGLSSTAWTTRRDLIGRGTFVRFYFANSISGTQFRIDGIGTYVKPEGKK